MPDSLIPRPQTSEEALASILDAYEPKFSLYRRLMAKRMKNILLVSTLYDAFIIEEDGSLTEQIWSQYVGMRLTDPPTVHRASTTKKALSIIGQKQVDLVLTMSRMSDSDPFQFAEKVREAHPELPVVLLVTDPSELAHLPPPDERKAIDKIFLWNNDPQTLLAIIKLMEDRTNVDEDTANGKVRVILLLEDSIVHYSSFLPMMYTVILKLTRNLIDAGLNDLHKQLRMRSRAKILLAETYEDGMALFEKYQDYIIGVVSDVRYWRRGIHDPDAGFDFVKEIKTKIPSIPVLLQSAEPEKNRDRAYAVEADFADKNSSTLLFELKKFLMEQMGFGDFVFKNPATRREIDRASDVFELLDKLKTVPIESVVWHARHNHISNWMMARTEVTIAENLRHYKVEDFETHEEVRNTIADTIADVLSEKQQDVIANFSVKRPAYASGFMLLGEGSMGGKGRGIAFARYLLNRTKLYKRFPSIDFDVPPALVVGADEFDQFLSDNNLKKAALEHKDFKALAKIFRKGYIRNELVDALRYWLKRNRKPLAVRSSSILEDSHLQPFAGLYATYILPNNAPNDEIRLERLLQAIKMVWAYTFNPHAKAYFRQTTHRIEEEKMAVVIMELFGKAHDDDFYPTLSGVAQSYNFYPFGPMKPEDGVAHVGVGLGKIVVDGGQVLRFCPSFPNIFPQFSSTDDWLKNTQKELYVLRLDTGMKRIGIDPDASLALKPLALAEEHGELDDITGVFCPDDEVIRESLSHKGPRIVNLHGILKYNEFPLKDILKELFTTFEKAMGCAVEIEFAVNLNKRPQKSEFRLLQIRPLVATAEREAVTIHDAELEEAWLYSKLALGNGTQNEIRDVIYIPPEVFERKEMQEIIAEIAEMNARMKEAKTPYALLGFGRWGSKDPWLGIGVGWGDISMARVMMEASLPDFVVDPSHGSHFFHNITSLGIGYLTIRQSKEEEFIDWDWLDRQPEAYRTKHLRHIHFELPTKIKIDGKTGRAIALRPKKDRA